MVLSLPGFGLVVGALSIVIAAIVSAWSIFVSRRQADRWAAIASFYTLTPEQFERHVADTFRYLGYSTSLTRRVGDQGVDVIASKGLETMAIQCKRYSDRASNSSVQAVHAGATYYECNKALVVCLGGFSNAAVELARSTSVDLLDGNQYADLVHRLHVNEARKRFTLPRGRALVFSVLLFIGGSISIAVDLTRGLR